MLLCFYCHQIRTTICSLDWHIDIWPWPNSKGQSQGHSYFAFKYFVNGNIYRNVIITIKCDLLLTTCSFDWLIYLRPSDLKVKVKVIHISIANISKMVTGTRNVTIAINISSNSCYTMICFVLLDLRSHFDFLIKQFAIIYINDTECPLANVFFDSYDLHRGDALVFKLTAGRPNHRQRCGFNLWIQRSSVYFDKCHASGFVGPNEPSVCVTAGRYT